jgi:hypothetical protein
MTISPFNVTGAVRFQTQLGSTVLRSAFWFSAELAFQVAAGPAKSAASGFRNGPKQFIISAGALPAQGVGGSPPMSSGLPWKCSTVGVVTASGANRAVCAGNARPGGFAAKL